MTIFILAVAALMLILFIKNIAFGNSASDASTDHNVVNDDTLFLHHVSHMNNNYTSDQSHMHIPHQSVPDMSHDFAAEQSGVDPTPGPEPSSD